MRFHRPRLLFWLLPLVALTTIGAAWRQVDIETERLETKDRDRVQQVDRERVALAKAVVDAGLLLVDRRGAPLATLEADGSLVLADGVAASIVPRQVAELALREREAALRDRRALRVLRLSLDLELSRVALASFRWHRGSIVLLEPATGEILAAVSDPRTWRGGGTPAFEQFREPASIAKLITTTAYLRAGLDPDAALSRRVCNGHGRYAGEMLYCPHIGGRLRGLDRALGISCNMAFADLGVEIGRERLIDEYRRYGFLLPSEEAETGRADGRILIPHGDDRQLADLSIGLDDAELTPLHAALLAAVFASDDGRMPTPTLLAAREGVGFAAERVEAAPGRAVVDPQWLPGLRRAMTAVAERGTGRHMAPRNFPVAMKTGTASHPRYGFHVNYVGFGPTPEPTIAFSVRITDQPTSRKVRAAARVVTAKLLRDLARALERRGETPPVIEQHSIRIAKSPAPGSPSGASSSSDLPAERVARRR